MDKLTEEEISEFREIFNLVDRNGSGSINKVELGELMDTLGMISYILCSKFCYIYKYMSIYYIGIDASPEEIDAMVAEIDQGLFRNNHIILFSIFIYIYLLISYNYIYDNLKMVMVILILKNLLLLCHEK